MENPKRQDSAGGGRQKNPKSRVGIIIFGVVCTLTLVGFIVAARINTLRNDPLRAFMTPIPNAAPTSTPRANPDKTPIITFTPLPAPSPTAAPQQVLGANTINIVLMGLDSDEAREAAGMGWRSDTIALLVIDVEKPACTVLSVPRDTRARVSKLSSTGKMLGTQYNKINSAFNFGGGPEKSGHENLIASLEKLLFDGLNSDVRLHYYASIDMDGIGLFADAVEGVPITLAYDVPGFGKKGEKILLKGSEARAFVRLRHGVTGGSDIGRIDRQQAFIRAFASRVQEMGAREAVPLLWGALSTEVHTNMSTEQILVLADLLARLDLEGTRFITLPGRCKTIEGRSYYVPDTKEIRSLALELWGE